MYFWINYSYLHIFFRKKIRRSGILDLYEKDYHPSPSLLKRWCLFFFFFPPFSPAFFFQREQYEKKRKKGKSSTQTHPHPHRHIGEITRNIHIKRPSFTFPHVVSSPPFPIIFHHVFSFLLSLYPPTTLSCQLPPYFTLPCHHPQKRKQKNGRTPITTLFFF